MAVYSEDQVDLYLEFVCMPSRFLRKNNPSLDVEFLNALHVHQICTIPFENLDIHYSPRHEINLDPHHLYTKFVSSKGRGGYCMENGIFFNHILRALGFHAYLAGGRVRPRTDGVPGGAYMGWVHCVNIVVFPDGSRYLTDVGYGGDGPVAPLALVQDCITPNIGAQELRLMYESLPDQVDPTQKHWVFQFRNGPEKEFNACYSFLDREFLPQDFEVMSFFASKHHSSYMTNTAVVMKFLHTDFEIYGKRMLVNEQMRENRGGKTSVMKVFTTERERVDALEKILSITLSSDEQTAIFETKLALS